MSGAAELSEARPFVVFRWPRLLVLYCAICPPAAVLIGFAFWPMWGQRPLLALGSAALSMALLCAGILLLDERDQAHSAAMLLGSSVLLTAGWLDTWHVGPLPLISVPASPAGTILAAWAMFRYPNSPHTRWAGNRFFTGLLACFMAGEILYIVTSRPQWAGFAASAWWPALLPDRSLSAVASEGLDLAGIGFAVAYMALWVARWRRSRGIARTLALPVAIAASVTCAIIIVELAADVMSARAHVMNVIYTVEAYLQIGVPAAFVVSVLRRRFARTRIADLLLRLRGPERVSVMVGALRSVFEDPALDVVDWAPGLRPADDTRTVPAVPDGPASVRLRLPVRSTSGEQLAVILADPSLSANGDLVQPAVAAAALTLENAQLEIELAAQLQEVQESRLRIIQAGIVERRRLERDLHDGVQIRLIALDVLLSTAKDDVIRPETLAVINRVRAELTLVIGDLRDLAHGIHPTVLSQFGLDQAIRSMARRYTIPIDVDLPDARFGEAAELIAYYVIAESVTNAIKHARARRISVHGKKSGGSLWVTVTDDGQGGARADAGTGIRGIFDRVHGIGGTAELDSPPGRGTTVKVVIPCA
jgi:signal transduction histidine kinase